MYVILENITYFFQLVKEKTHIKAAVSWKRRLAGFEGRITFPQGKKIHLMSSVNMQFKATETILHMDLLLS